MWLAVEGSRRKIRVHFTVLSCKHSHNVREVITIWQGNQYWSPSEDCETSFGKMRSSVVCLLLMSVLIAIGSINGGNTSSASNKSLNQLEGRTIICNAVQDSHCNEAIKSLEATLLAAMEKKFEQLMATMNLNKTSHGNSPGKASLALFFVYIFLTSLNFYAFFFLGQVSHLPRVRKFMKITSKF